jgi:hypothetical protein
MVGNNLLMPTKDDKPLIHENIGQNKRNEVNYIPFLIEKKKRKKNERESEEKQGELHTMTPYTSGMLKSSASFPESPQTRVLTGGCPSVLNF